MATLSNVLSVTAYGELHLSKELTEISWMEALREALEAPSFAKLERRLAQDCIAGKKIFPPNRLVFNALNMTPIYKVRVVMLGQDPYHDDDQAQGLSFSVPYGFPTPPSLINIYNELMANVPDFEMPDHGCLEKWAERGVLLLNAALTVEAHRARSHMGYGWQKFTNQVIKVISDSCIGIVFILLGSFAKSKSRLIDHNKHAVFKASHPSPRRRRGAPFLGNQCFYKADQALINAFGSPMNWILPKTPFNTLK